MTRRPVPGRVTAFLFFLFFLGFAVAVLAFVDLHWNHWLFKPAGVKTTTSTAAVAPVTWERS